jgi:hypothetical protein
MIITQIVKPSSVECYPCELCTMERFRIIDQLARHGDVFRAHFTGLSAQEVRWKPSPEKWCALEIVCHLYDEERDDFRARLMHVLTTPDAPLPATDPSGWMIHRRYLDQDFDTALRNFLEERDRTVTWLRTLTNAPWTNAHPHPRVGPISADLFLVNWVAHDLHHLRQLINLRYEYLKSLSNEPLDYAGTW